MVNTIIMQKKSLFDANPHLQDPDKYRESLITSVSSSTAIETGTAVTIVNEQLTDAFDGIIDLSSGKTILNSQ